MALQPQKAFQHPPSIQHFTYDKHVQNAYGVRSGVPVAVISMRSCNDHRLSMLPRSDLRHLAPDAGFSRMTTRMGPRVEVSIGLTPRMRWIVQGEPRTQIHMVSGVRRVGETHPTFERYCYCYHSLRGRNERVDRIRALLA